MRDMVMNFAARFISLALTSSGPLSALPRSLPRQAMI